MEASWPAAADGSWCKVAGLSWPAHGRPARGRCRRAPCFDMSHFSCRHRVFIVLVNCRHKSNPATPEIGPQSGGEQEEPGAGPSSPVAMEARPTRHPLLVLRRAAGLARLGTLAASNTVHALPALAACLLALLLVCKHRRRTRRAPGPGTCRRAACSPGRRTAAAAGPLPAQGDRPPPALPPL